MSVDNTHEHITNGGAWLELTEADIIEYVNWLLETSRAEGRLEGSEAAKESLIAQMLEAETERIGRSNEALAQALATPPELVREV